MSKRLKRILSVTLAVVVCFGVGLVFKFGLHSKAAYIDPGTYGDFEYKQMPYRDGYDAENRIEITKYNGNDSVVTIPDTIEGITVRSIGENAFKGNSTITKVVFPDTLQEIHVGAFMDCTNLSIVRFPKSLYSLSANSFANCEKLKSITIPNVSGRYNGQSYNQFQVLTQTVTDEDGKYVYTDYGDLEKYSSFEGCNNLETVVFEEGTIVIPRYLFQNCIAITSVTIPNSVEIIGSGAFRGCSNLETVVFESNSNLKELRGFEDCSNLKTINVPDTVETIGGFVRTSIESISLPDSLTKIENCAFYHCSNLKQLELPHNIKHLGSSFIEGTSITTITVPQSVESGGSAFKNYSYKVILEEGLKTLPEYFFKDSKIENIWLPESLKKIESGALYCSIKEITIPKNVREIANNCIYGNVTIRGYLDSYAREYAENNHYAFAPIDEPVPPEGTVGIKGKEFNENNIYYYYDDYFLQDSTVYNQSLASMSLALALSTFGQWDGKADTYDYYDIDNDINVETLLTNCGFERYKQYPVNETPTSRSMGCSIASKHLPDGSNLLAVAVRSDAYVDEYEWLDLFDIGTTKDGTEYGSNYCNHDGFEYSAKKIFHYIEDYFSEYYLAGNYKIWITGYGNGGAVATRTAKIIHEDYIRFRYDGQDYTMHMHPNNVYAYGFATPASANTLKYPENKIHGNYWNDVYYQNIFNIIDYNDLYTLLPPKEWSFDRWGVTKILPYQESAVFTKDWEYIEEVKSRMKSMSQPFFIDGFGRGNVNTIVSSLSADPLLLLLVKKIDLYPILSSMNYTVGTFDRKLVNAIADTIGSRDDYYYNYQATMSDINMSNTGSILHDSMNAIIDLSPSLVRHHPILLLIALTNLKYLNSVHCNPDYYLTWMHLMDSNYADSLPTIWGAPDYRVASTNCPVNVFVYDNNNKLVASIVDEKPVDIEDSCIISSVNENGEKEIYLPLTEEYRIEIVAREDCDVTYSVNEFNAVSGNQTRKVNYSSINVDEGESLTGSLAAVDEEDLDAVANTGSEAEYRLFDEEEIDCSSNYLNDQINSHVYAIETEDSENGILVGGGKFIQGDYAKITAVPELGFQVEDYYLNGNKVVDDDTDEDPSTIRFEVNKNATVSATFKKIPGLFSSEGTNLTSRTTTTLLYNPEIESEDYTYKFLVHNKTTNQWYKIRDFAQENTIEWFTGVGGEKSLYVDIKDITTDTIVKRVELNVTVSDPTLNIDSFTISPGTTVAPSVSATLEANVSGGSGDYLYKFIVYNQNTKQWYKLRDFAPENTFDWFTGPEGEKTLYVDVKDASNDTIVKRAELNVSVSDPKLKVESFTIEPEGELATNTRALLQAKAIGGAGDYQYKFIVYNESTKQWYKLKDFGPESAYDWYTGPAGNKTLYVDVRDAEGTVVRKGLTVTVNE